MRLASRLRPPACAAASSASNGPRAAPRTPAPAPCKGQVQESTYPTQPEVQDPTFHTLVSVYHSPPHFAFASSPAPAYSRAGVSLGHRSLRGAITARGGFSYWK